MFAVSLQLECLIYILIAHCYGLVFSPPTNGLNEQLTAN